MMEFPKIRQVMPTLITAELTSVQPMMLGRRFEGMQSVMVKRTELLERLKKNREKHVAIVVEAQKKYREMVIEELDNMLQDAKEGKKIRHHVGLQAPLNMTREYDRCIAMLEMSVEDTIEISQSDFSCYVLDDWGWKQQFVTRNSTYSSSLNADMVDGED